MKKSGYFSLRKQMGRAAVFGYFIILTIGLSLVGISIISYQQKRCDDVLNELKAEGEMISRDISNVSREAMNLYSNNNELQRLKGYQNNTSSWEQIVSVWDSMEKSSFVLNSNDCLWVTYGDFSRVLYTKGAERKLEENEFIRQNIEIISETATSQYGKAIIDTGVSVYEAYYFLGTHVNVFGMANLTSKLYSNEPDEHSIFQRNPLCYGIIVNGNVYGGDGEKISFLPVEFEKEKNKCNDFMVYYHKLPEQELAVIAYEKISLWSYIKPEHLWTLFLLLLTILPGIRIYRLLQYKLVEPLQSMTDSMKKIQNGKWELFDTDFDIEEIEEVKKSIKTMIQEITDWQARTYEEQLERQAAQMQYLMLQLTPHFYLNCLKNTNALLMSKKYEEAQEYLIHISVHFQYLMKNSMELVSLKSELDFTQNYLQMMHCEEQCEYKVESEVLNYRIPMLCIQGIVENSIKYASDNRKELFLSVQIRHFKTEEEEYINITIRDNGRGYPPDMLALINSRTPETNGEHVGIINLRRRLYLLYGDRASCYFENKDGAVSDLLIPVNG